MVKVEGNNIRIYSKSGAALTEPIKIQSLGDKKLSQIAHSMEAVKRNDRGEISEVFLYEKDEDTNNPEYQFRVRILGDLNVNQL